MKVIQVGIGGMGNAWIKAVRAHEQFEHAGFVEIDENVINQQVKEYQLDPSRIFRTLEEAISSVPADGVIDVTPPKFHRHISITAMEAGLPVLSEKPLADNPDDVRAIVQKANETGVLHMVAQNYRYTPNAQTVKQVLSSGDLGRVANVVVNYFKGIQVGGFRGEMTYPLIADMAIHHFDLMRFFLGSNPKSVYGRSWNPSWSTFKGDASAAVWLEFENGVCVTYDGSWCTNGCETTWHGDWRFECENGVLEMVDDHIYQQCLMERHGFQSQYTDRVEIPHVVMERQAQMYLLNEFYLAVTQGIRPATTCQDNFYSISTVFDVIRSFETESVIHANSGV